MNSDTNIIENKKSRFETDGFKVYQNGTLWGVIAGVGMAFFLFLLDLVSVENSIGLKFIKYLILFGILAYGLNTYKKRIGENFQFKKGIVLGAVISLVSAISLVILDVIAYAISDDFAFNKFGVEPSSGIELATIAAMVFFEAFVYGMIITFIILQLIKPGRADV